MAVLNKERSKKTIACGPVNVGYANYAVPGLYRNKHVTLQIPGERYHTLRIPMEEASLAAINMLRIAMEHDGLPFSTIKRHLMQKGMGTSFVPTED